VLGLGAVVGSDQFSYPDLTDSSSDRFDPDHCLDPTAMARAGAIFPGKGFPFPPPLVVSCRGADRCPD
jgi:hypothetical protein